MSQVFDSFADSYDRWYDTKRGESIFQAERKCLQSLQGPAFENWLDVGVGTGRFAHALGISTGTDPSTDMLLLAAKRDIRVTKAIAEELPFLRGSFDGVLMALALCFLADARKALIECHRVVNSEGRLLLGVVPEDSAWGRAYRAKGAEGHPFYAHARFRSSAETIQLARDAGFCLVGAASTLFWRPDQEAESNPRIEQGIVSGAGFVGLLFGRGRLKHP